MTTDPRSLRDVMLEAARARMRQGTVSMSGKKLSDGVDLAAAFDAALAALRTALAANPGLIDELLPGGYAEAASIVRALGKADETEDWLLDTDTLMVRVREWVSDMSALRTSARAWVTEHPESE